MKKISEIVKELKIKWWKEPHYFIVDANKSKAVITNLGGMVLIAKYKGIDIGVIKTQNPDEIEHDLGNDLESLGIFIEPLQFSGEWTYQEIKIVETINQFLGE